MLYNNRYLLTSTPLCFVLYFVLVEREFILSKPNVELVFEIECSNPKLERYEANLWASVRTTKKVCLRGSTFKGRTYCIRNKSKLQYGIQLGFSGYFKIIGIIFSILLQLLTLRFIIHGNVLGKQVTVIQLQSQLNLINLETTSNYFTVRGNER